MASNIAFNPYLTTNALGSFSVQSNGLVQGAAMDDPSVRNYLAGGTLAVTEILPMWGGCAIFENIPGATSDGATGGTVGRATSLTNLTGFSVVNQAHNWVTSPQSQAPSAGAGMTVPFYRLGSGARIAVAMDPSLVGLDGGLITQQVSWDFFNQRLQAYDASTPTVSVTSITSSYSNGVYTFVVVAAASTTEGAVGDAINVSGVTGTGASLVNGNQIITAYTDNQNFSFQVRAASGAIATGALSGTIVLNYGTGALPVKVLETQVGNSKIIAYDAVNNYVNWTNNGSAAVILI
ncbi:hypothetical protein [Herbaspirillum huttiense]|uniref:hypothetical protein n=1 Tax=Herbaspirillum huttiense TaxID=863372 RepID=UPI0031E1C04D